MIIEDVVNYWIATAEHDRETMDVLFKSGRYSDSLFFGHIILEKILKGLVVKNTKEQAPYIHDLLQLYKLSGISLSSDEIDLLDKANDFNIRARYPERKLEFYKQCTKDFSSLYIDKINIIYKKLWQMLK
jgi:HEPN domain-containing protein